MKSHSVYRVVGLGILIFASVLLAASGTVQLPTPTPGANRNAATETAMHPAMGNPAAVYCRELGYAYEIESDNGQRGICTLPDGTACDAWAFLQGKCGQGFSYCAQQGYEIVTVDDGRNPFSSEYALCVTSEGVAIGSVTELSNLSEKATGCGGETPGGELPPIFEEGEEYVPPVDVDPPTAFDWRDYLGSDWLTPVKDQGICGSCWAFAAVGITEAAHNISSNDPNLDLDLSEQYLVADCSSAGNCCGGYKEYALKYIRDSGIPDEVCLPYVDGFYLNSIGCSCSGGTCDSNCTFNTGNDPEDSCSDRTCSNRCADWSTRLAYIESTGDVGTDPQTIKQALVDIGPLAANMRIGEAYGGYWDEDRIYHCSPDGPVNHGVIVVGYSDTGGYWWVKNSWGTEWEEDGYFKLGYGECSIEQAVRWAEVAASDVGPLEYVSHTIDDTGTIIGDGDGIVDCGETIELNITLRNQGTAIAIGVAASLSTGDSYITITDSQETFPSIAGGGTGKSIGEYVFEVEPDAPDGHIIHFDLLITASNGGPWSDTFEVPVTCTNAPPYTPSGPTPTDGDTGVPVTTDLSWTGGDPDPGDTVTYDVRFGTADPPTTLLCNDVPSTSPTCDPGTLSDGTSYYWYVVATDNHGASTSGPVWDFTTAAGGDAYEPDDTSGEANWIDDGAPQTHSIVPVGDVDWVTFSLPAKSEVVIETLGASGETSMWLYDSGLTELEYDGDDGTDVFSRIDRLCDVDALPAGTYYVKIGESGNNDEIPAYEIAFTVVHSCLDYAVYLPVVLRNQD